jgi:hypothetical protein
MNTSRQMRYTVKDESGVGIMMAFGIGLLLLAMGVLALSLFNIGQNSAGRHLGYEQAIHVAENGIDTALAKQQRDQGNYTTDAAWGGTNGQLPAGTDTVAEEETWLRARAAQAEANWATLPSEIKGHSPEGDYILVSPSNRQTVYAVGWVPSITAPKHVRYIKTEWLFSTWRPDHALLVNGDLDLQSGQVLGLTGNVHANGNTHVQGGQATISGLISTSGTFSGTTLPDPPNIPTAEEGAPQQDVPVLDPREIWRRGTVVTGYQANWYDLCPDGRVRSLYTGAGGIVSSPCTGLTVDDASPGSFRGWSYGGSEWDYNGSGNYDGTYYAYQGNLKISGNPGSGGTPWKASLIAEAAPGPAAGACANTRLTGDILVTGTPNTLPYMTGLGYIAGRDLKINGNPGPGSTGIYSGFYAAAEQVEIGGNVSLSGSVVVQDLCDTPTSPINDNNVHGSVTITYDGGLDVLVGATIRSALWLEL